MIRIAIDPAMLKASPIETALRSAADAGYRYLELGNRDDIIGAYGPVAASSNDLSRIRRAADLSGIEIVSVAVIQAWSDPDPEVRAKAVAWWRDGLATVERLGCRRINTELSGDPDRRAESREALLRSIDELLPALDGADIDIVVEPHPGDFVETTAEALELARSVDTPRFRYLHCLPHAFYLGGSAVEQIELARGRFDHIHIADTYRPGRTIINPPARASRVHQHSDIGVGELDWPAIARALGSVGFDGIATVQVFGWDERAEESFRLNLGVVRQLLATGVAGVD